MRRLVPITAVLVFLSALFGATTTTAAADDEAMIFFQWRSADDIGYDKCFGVAGGNMANGSKVILWPCSGVLDQQWSAIPLLTDNGYYLMRNKKNTNKCLSVSNNWKSPGVQLVIWDCQNAPGQLWDARYFDVWGYEIVNKNSQLPIAVSGGRNETGAAIIQWTRNNRLEQVWSNEDLV